MFLKCIITNLLLGLCSLHIMGISTEKMHIQKSSLFIEVGGNAPWVSMNYDYLIPTRIEKVKTSFTLGATHHFGSFSDFIVAPQLNVLYGNELMLELGYGAALPVAYMDEWVHVPRAGFRRQKRDGGMFYRLAFTPIISSRNQTAFLPMFGVGLGYTWYKRH